jgi:hypothetical protein
MNPKTDTPESAEAMSKKAARARGRMIGEAAIMTGEFGCDDQTYFYELCANIAEDALEHAQQSALTLKHAETAERLQRCEEDARKYHALKGIVAQLLADELLSLEDWDKAKAAFNAHPTRNEGEKKV